MAKTLDVPNTHADRPTPKTELPFRVIEGSNPLLLEYYGEVHVSDDREVYHPNGNAKLLSTVHKRKKIPFVIAVTQHFAEIPDANPLGWRILELMRMFWEKEAQVDGLLAKIDELATTSKLQEGDITKLTNQLREIKSRKG